MADDWGVGLFQNSQYSIFPIFPIFPVFPIFPMLTLSTMGYCAIDMVRARASLRQGPWGVSTVWSSGVSVTTLLPTATAQCPVPSAQCPTDVFVFFAVSLGHGLSPCGRQVGNVPKRPRWFHLAWWKMTPVPCWSCTYRYWARSTGCCAS